MDKKQDEIRTILQDPFGQLPMSEEYKAKIIDHILRDVVEDVNAAADPVNWTDQDVRLAVGRVLCDHLGITSG